MLDLNNKNGLYNRGLHENKGLRNRALILSLLGLSLSTTSFVGVAQQGLTTLYKTPKNIIVMIGDGMGPAYTSAFRYYQDNPNTEEVEQTVFDRLQVGTSSTYPAKVSDWVTDSAAAATALATGHKTYNGAISVDLDKQPLTTLFELAKQQGKATGIAVTSQVNHATPAAFLSHNENRQNYLEIAESYLHSKAEVILGGGQQYFSPKLRQAFTQQGYQVIDQYAELAQITQTPVLGVFAEVGLPWMQDRATQPMLAEMTQKALTLLSSAPKGFVLLIEGSQIDWAGHKNDIAAAMAEMKEFSYAIEVAEQFVRENPETLLLITADHSTGGMSIGANGDYLWRPEILKNMQASADTLAKRALATSDSNAIPAASKTHSTAAQSDTPLPPMTWQATLQLGLGFAPTPEQWQALELAYQQAKTAQTLKSEDQQATQALAQAIRHLISSKSNTGWTTSGHTGIDVGVFAAGTSAGLFQGHQDNIDIGQKLQQLLRAKP